jgi:streptogramin lyase
MALDGRVTVLTTVAGHALNIMVGPDSAFWLTIDSKIARITPTGILDRFDIGARSITTGADGAIWFIRSGAAGIGRLTLARDVLELPSPIDQPNQIVATADGAIWLGNNSQIARIGADRNASIFKPLKALHRIDPHATLGQMVPDSNGRNVVFIMSHEPINSGFGDLAPGSATSLSLEGVFTQLGSWYNISPQYIARGSDAFYIAAWFCPPAVSTCGATAFRMDYDGHIRELGFLPWRNPGRQVTGITQGGDGNVWVSYIDYEDYQLNYKSNSGIARVADR